HRDLHEPYRRQRQMCIRDRVSVLQYLSQGYSNKQISEQMFISNKTVSTYKARLLLKLNAGSLVDLIEFAKRNTLI
ncbi:response regulator transcription factor, partial [Pseudomonas aeruginosa]|nr:response regulator transcription factor [Pseudomonas aeruginosa]